MSEYFLESKSLRERVKLEFNAKLNEVKGKISSITSLATTFALNTKINEVKGKRPNITNLATTN